MKFYRLSINTDNGFQAITDSPPKELLNRNLYSPYKFNTIDSIKLDLDKGKKITDVLNIGTINLDGFPIRNKFCKLIRDFNLASIQFVEIIDKDLEDYSFMFFNSDLTHKLDYQKSDFKIIEDILGEIIELDIKVPKKRDDTLKAYDKHCSESIFNKLIPKNGYHFIQSFDINNIDAFRIGHFDKSFYVSERLKNTLEENMITGVGFTEEKLFVIKPIVQISSKKWWLFGK